MKLIHRIALLACLLLAAPAFADLLPKPKVIDGFLLFDHNGKPVTQGSLKGKVTLLFAGYTRCPDVCPSTLATLSVVKRQVPNINVVFLSIDPADGPAQLKGYADTFGVTAVSLSDDTITLLHSLGTHWHNPKAPLSAHPAAVFALDSQGRWVAYWRYPQDVTRVIADLKQIR